LPDSPFPEMIFYEILGDLSEFLSALILVGGWVPFLYARHVWRLSISSLVTTADIDFGSPQGLLQLKAKPSMKRYPLSIIANVTSGSGAHGPSYFIEGEKFRLISKTPPVRRRVGQSPCG